MRKPPKIIFWDWHGVLGIHGFWHKSEKVNGEVAKLTSYVFSDKQLVNDWMRGAVSIEQLIEASGATVSKDQLAEFLELDWAVSAAINTQLVSTVKAIYPDSRNVIVTDNMDVFADYYKQNTYIAQHFERVFNSSEYKVLKDDKPGLFERVLSELELQNFEGCLLLDDSASNCERFRSLGGETILIEGGYR